jgi:hypothetical protein
MAITIKFGPGNTIQQPVSKFATADAAVADPAVKSILGYDPGAVTASINGVQADGCAPLRDGDVIELHTKAHSKAIIA